MAKQPKTRQASKQTGNGNEVRGFRGPQVCKLVGITYRQLDYWARTGLLKPSVAQARGSGSQRLYSFTDVVQLRVIKRILDSGMSLHKIRQAVEWLREQIESGQDPAELTLLSDGASIYAAAGAQEVFDVLHRGQAVLAIAIGPVVEELNGDLLTLEEAGGESAEELGGVNELSGRAAAN